MGESGLDLASLYKRSGGVDMSVLVSYLEDRLSLANNDVSKVTPPWAQETWQMLITELDAFSPDVLVFANARDAARGVPSSQPSRAYSSARLRPVSTWRSATLWPASRVPSEGARFTPRPSLPPG